MRLRAPSAILVASPESIFDLATLTAPAGANMCNLGDNTMWLDQLHDVLAACLDGARAGLLSAPGTPSAAPLPVRYQSSRLAVTCLVPRWSDLADALQQQPVAMLIVPAAPEPTCWLQYQGQARLVSLSAWAGPLPDALSPQRAGERYLVVALAPQRLDLFDERRGWGARETLDLVRAQQEIFVMEGKLIVEL